MFCAWAPIPLALARNGSACEEAFVLVPLGILLGALVPPWWAIGGKNRAAFCHAQPGRVDDSVAAFCSSSTGSPAARTESQYAPQRFSALFQRHISHDLLLFLTGLRRHCHLCDIPLSRLSPATISKRWQIMKSALNIPGIRAARHSTTPTCFPSLGGPLRGVAAFTVGSCQNTPSGFNLENLSSLRCSALWAYCATFAIA